MKIPRRRFIILVAAMPALLAMTPLMRTVILSAPPLSPVAQGIVNALRKQNTPPDLAMVQWIEAAITATGSRHYVVQCQPAESLSIGFTVTGTGSLRVWWGDGRSDRYQLTAQPQAIGHTYATGARRPVVLVGNATLL